MDENKIELIKDPKTIRIRMWIRASERGAKDRPGSLAFVLSLSSLSASLSFI